MDSRVTAADIDRITERLYLRTAASRSAFRGLLVLSAVIAGAGVVADSVATVIGAMIVAPLMTPILGTALAAVLADRQQVIRGVAVILGGAAAVVVIAYALGLLVPLPVDSDTNTQVAARVSPGLIDLVSALATGVVGAFALVRADISDALPGVAIAISLVPPLSVVGLTLEAGRPLEALGALLLFATNIAAMIATGAAVFSFYRVRAAAAEAGKAPSRMRPGAIAVIVGFVAVIAAPLSVGSYHVVQEQRAVIAAQPLADRWAQDQGWRIIDVAYQRGVLQVAAVGPPPDADPGLLRRELDAAGLADVNLRVSLVVGGTRELPATG